MKKNILAILAVVFASTILFSCSDDKEKNNPGPGEDAKEYLDYPYSELSPEDQKKKLSADAEVTVKKMEALPNEKSVQLISSFQGISSDLFYLLENSDVEENEIAPASLTREEAISDIIKLASYNGKYEWNLETEEWKKSDEAVDMLIAIFPSTKGGKVNDGKLEVKALAPTVINGNEIPSNVEANLYVADKKEGEVTAIATGVNESSFVETVDVTAVLGAYNLVANVNKKGSNNTSKVDFLKDNATIIDANVDLEANITAEMLEKEDVSSVKDGNFVANVTDELVAAGYVDGKTLAPELLRIEKEISAIDEKWYSSSDRSKDAAEILELQKAQVAALNANTNIALVSSKDEYKVAKITFDLEVEKVEGIVAWREKLDAEGNVVEDEHGYPIYEKYTYTGYDVTEVYILNFNDETKVDAKVFFGAGFEKVFNMWKDILGKVK